MSLKGVNNVCWVDKIDWKLRKFHGEEYSTPYRLIIFKGN